ncbi:AraC family transcriptional regulator [Streptomyces rimosus]|uniref:AraC family transcriptional regulator n=1 Tax=Streptomyces rimosus TaxID=1927 RepID=UPI0004CA7867|nr:AraC family transcriptional regulator [Streptomyces rimosus]
MDALTGLLEGPRARGAFLMRSVLSPPWSLRIQDEAPLTVVTMARGEGWVVTGESGQAGEAGQAGQAGQAGEAAGRMAATPLHPGDVAILRGPAPYTVADDPATAPRVVIHPGQVSATPQGEALCEAMGLGVRTWGDGPDGPVVLLSGTYQMRGEVNQRLLRTLPPLVRLTADAWNSSLVTLLEAEIGRDAPGQEVVLDRLLDLLLTAALRAWFARPEAGVPGGYDAQGDPVVGRALRLLHAEPARAWTVAALAAASGVSRAALGRRFTALVGEPPMTYLTNLRLTLAADLLREPDATLGAVARRVGYGSPFALSAAFKRVRGVSPRDHRQGGAAPRAGA